MFNAPVCHMWLHFRFADASMCKLKGVKSNGLLCQMGLYGAAFIPGCKKDGAEILLFRVVSFCAM